MNEPYTQKFKGCCYFHDGSYSNTIALKTIDEVLFYIKLQIATGKDARILDAENNPVMHVMGNHIIFPEICRKVDAISGERTLNQDVSPERKEEISCHAS